MSQFAYVATAQKPTNVTHSLVGSFTGCVLCCVLRGRVVLQTALFPANASPPRVIPLLASVSGWFDWIAARCPRRPTDVNLIIAKTNRIEVHAVTTGDLQPVFEAPIYGRVTCMELLRPQVRTSQFASL